MVSLLLEVDIILCLLLKFLLVETGGLLGALLYDYLRSPFDIKVLNQEYCAVVSSGRFSSGIKTTQYKWKMLLFGLSCLFSYS